jgi:DNA polymerase-3 subunit beta
MAKVETTITNIKYIRRIIVMHVRANRETLNAMLSKMGGVVERRQTLPILGNLLLTTNEGYVQVTGTDLEMEVRARTTADIVEPGEITLPARKLIDICRALPGGMEVSLKVERDRASLVAGRSRFLLSTLPAKDFPTMESHAGIDSIDLEQRTLKYLLGKTAFAMANQDVRYYLNGLLLEVKRDRLRTVATDGHRLAKVEEEVALEIAEEIQVILPRKTVLELNRLLGVGEGGGGMVRIEISKKAFRVYMDDVVVTSKLVDGRYPDYEKVIPPISDRVAYADRETLKEALWRTAILSNEKFRGVRLSLNKGQLTLQAHNPEQEEAEEELEVTYTEDPMEMGFNVGYLVDVLNVLDEEEVEIGFRGTDSSVILRNRGREQETFVVMPMML